MDFLRLNPQTVEILGRQGVAAVLPFSICAAESCCSSFGKGQQFGSRMAGRGIKQRLYESFKKTGRKGARLEAA